MSDINLSLPGWPQVIDEPNRKVFTSGDGYKLELNTRGEKIDIAVYTTAPEIEAPDKD